ESTSTDYCPKLLCAPGPGIIEEAAARLLARTALAERIPAEALSHHSLASEVASRAAECDASAVCMVQISPVTRTHSRHLVKTLAAKLRGAEQIQFVEMLIEAPCGPESERQPGSVSAQMPRRSAPTSSAASGEPNVVSVKSFKELIDRLSD